MSLSLRRAAAIKLADITRVASVLHDSGEILHTESWLKVLANILSSAPKKWNGTKSGRAPPYFGLSKEELFLAARACRLHVRTDQIVDQVAATKAWRNKETHRLGRPHYVPMSPTTIGRLLGVTAKVRLEAKSWSIIPYGATKEELMEQYRERHREGEVARRRTKNIKPRDQSLSRTKPWNKLGISRRTWYRKGKPEPAPEPPKKPLKMEGRVFH